MTGNISEASIAECIASRKDTVMLEIPACESMLMLTRMTISGMLAYRSCNFNTIEDVKAAAAESCYCLIQQPCGFTRIRLNCAWEGNVLVLCVHGEAPTRQAARLSGMEKCEEVALCILESMVDDVEISYDDGAIVGFCMQKRVC